ncbi:MAG: LacI family DNA-binding transcriptional regulator [Rhodobacteraceae bacterium]|nr:LacI family DNA-binding transcriptional regulator [Paracoccaceae bacterium]
MENVAAAAGVSIVTVSRAMNSPEIVSARTRAKITAAMSEIGYVPDLVARSMSQQRTRFVAAFVPTLFDPAFANIIQGLSDVLTAGSVHLLLGNTQYSVEEEGRLATAILGYRPVALALSGTTHAPALLRLISRAGIPVVEMWNFVDRPLDMVVGFRNQAAAHTITRHLIERGYRRIGFIGRPTEGNERTAARQRGYRAAMREAGLTVRKDWVLETGTQMEAGAQALDQMPVVREIEALVVTGDTVAAGVLLAALSRGIRVPEQLAVTGFGDLPISRHLPGGLTTIGIDSYAVGRISGQLLLDRIEGLPVKKRIVDVGFEVLARGSS